MADNNPNKNEQIRERNYKYKENYIIEFNSMHDVSEYEPREDTFELFEKGKENRFDEPKQRDHTAQNENENLIETNGKENQFLSCRPFGK